MMRDDDHRALVLRPLRQSHDFGNSRAVGGSDQGQSQCNDTPKKEGEEVDVRKHARKRCGRIIGGGDLGGSGHRRPCRAILADELIRLLDCKEQQQAAKATNEAIRGGVGTEVRWKSESRQKFHGVPR